MIRFSRALSCAPVPHAHTERSTHPRAGADRRRAERRAERRRSNVRAGEAAAHCPTGAQTHEPKSRSAFRVLWAETLGPTLTQSGVRVRTQVPTAGASSGAQSGEGATREQVSLRCERWTLSCARIAIP